MHAYRFGLFRVRSPLLTESLLVFSSSAYLDVSVRRVCDSWSSRLHRDGLPHSDINGSSVVCTSPLLFAAYHVLRRLREPRHPPYALSSLPTPLRSVRKLPAKTFFIAIAKRHVTTASGALLPGSIFSSLSLPFSLLLLYFPVLSMNSLYPTLILLPTDRFPSPAKARINSI